MMIEPNKLEIKVPNIFSWDEILVYLNREPNEVMYKINDKTLRRAFKLEEKIYLCDISFNERKNVIEVTLLNDVHWSKIEQTMVINFIVGQMYGTSAWQSFLLAWKRLGLSDDIINNSEIILHDYVLNINEWLSVTEDKFRLIIVGEKSKEIKDNHHGTGDGLCAFLFAPTVLVNQNNISEKARLYRSISTDENHLIKDLNDLIFYQARTGMINNLLIGKHSDKKDVAKAAILLNEHNNNLEQYYAELYIGIQGEFDIWMMLMFSLLNGKNVSAVDIIFSESNGRIILSRVKKIRSQE